jgi:CheY-like chemotaxis protein
MNILLVEDDENKREQILAFLKERLGQATVNIAKSLQSGLRSIIAGNVDLVLLDMTMPTFDIGIDEDGGRPQPLAGQEILRQMDRRKISVPIIVVTQFDKFGDGSDSHTLEELDLHLQEAHETNYMGAVYYNVALEGWKEELMQMISSIQQQKGE